MGLSLMLDGGGIKMNELVTADWHLTDKAQEEYKWDIFPRIVKLCKQHDIDKLYFLGDLTEKKDRHSSILVNKLVDGTMSLLDVVKVMVIIRGNHDYVDEQNPFFKFLQTHEQIQYVHRVVINKADNDLYVSHTANMDSLYQQFKGPYNRIFMHQPVTGATSSNSYKLTTLLDPGIFEGWAKQVYAGDIHVPQDVGLVRYVGAPYHVYFGDTYEPRIIIIKNGKEQSIKMHFPKKWHLTTSNLNDPKFANIVQDDLLKLTFVLDRSEFYKYDEYKKQIKDWAKGKGVNLCGMKLVSANKEPSIRQTLIKKDNKPLSHREIFSQFAKKNKLSSMYKDAAFELITEDRA